MHGKRLSFMFFAGKLLQIKHVSIRTVYTKVNEQLMTVNGLPCIVLGNQNKPRPNAIVY